MMLVHVLRSVSSVVMIVVVGVVVRGMRLAHPEVRRILYVVVVAVLLWWKVVMTIRLIMRIWHKGARVFSSLVQQKAIPNEDANLEEALMAEVVVVVRRRCRRLC